VTAVADRIRGICPEAEPVEDFGELTVVVPAGAILDVLRFCRDDPDTRCELLADLSAVHWPAGERALEDEPTTGWPAYVEQRDDGVMELDYILYSVTHHHRFRVRVNLPDVDPTIASASGLYAAANFMEREVYDLMGVTFNGHPNLVRVLMPDDWEGHPHRKDYPLGGIDVPYHNEKFIPPPDRRDLRRQVSER